MGKNEHFEEMKSLKKGDKIWVYNAELRADITGTVISVEVLDEGTEEEDVSVFFLDEGTYENEFGYVCDEATHERTDDYMGWCSGCDYLGKIERDE